MSGKTYGSNGDFPGVTVTTNGGSITGNSVTTCDDGPIGTLRDNTVNMWGHSIVLKGEDSIECAACEMEEEIPDVFQMASGFREVVYKMYILGKFKNSRCEPEYETDQSVLHDDKTNIGYDPNRVHWTNGGQYRIDVGDGVVVTDGTQIYDSTSPTYTAGQTLTEKESLQMQHDWKKRQQKQTSKNHSIGDMQAGGVDVARSGNTSISADLDEDDKQSLKDSLKQKMSDLGLR